MTDRWGTIHAVTLMSLPVASLIVGALALFFGFLSGLHKCYAGTPFTQWSIPGICFTASAICITSWRVKAPILVLQAVVMLFLRSSFVTLSHGPDYVGSEAYGRWIDRANESGRAAAENALKMEASRTRAAPPPEGRFVTNLSGSGYELLRSGTKNRSAGGGGASGRRPAPPGPALPARTVRRACR